ncbi:MAG: hypothetical protein WBM07_12885 [Chitinivibrionales bacterium]
MIRINLLKNTAVLQRRPLHIPRAVFFAAGGVVCAGILALAGMKGYAWYGAHHQTAGSAQERQVVKRDLAPSTYVRSNMVEEVVKEVNDSRLKLRESGMLSLPYDQLSFAEKINYEFLFTKNVCEMLTRAVPGGIGLKSLDMDNFQTVYAAGIGPSKDLIHEMLVSLKGEKTAVLPPPYSFIKPNGRDGFRFAFSCKTEFGLNLTDPCVDLSLSSIVSRNGLPGTLASFSRIARQSRIAAAKDISLVSTDKVGNYYRSIYRWTGTCSYKDFVRFITGLYNEKIPCAFKHCSLIAQTASTVKVESQIVITSKE